MHRRLGRPAPQRRPWIRLKHVALLVAAAALAGCTGSPDGRPTAQHSQPPQTPSSDAPHHATGAQPPTLLIQAEDATKLTLYQAGTAPVTVGISTLDSGSLTPARGPRGDLAIGMPPFTTNTHYPRAVITVTVRGPHDPLSPGSADIMWGADFKLNPRSESDSGVDNGDNLIQRGLAGEGAEYKAELDMRRAGCTVQGSQGNLVVRTQRQVHPGTWYRLRCIRRGPTLTVSVTNLNGTEHASSATKRGRVGVLDFPADVPLSIGGKVARTGQIIRSATDQFNGSIANPMVRIGPSTSR